MRPVDCLRDKGQRLVMLVFLAWVGSMWTVGFVVVPRLFAVLPPAEAGRLAAGLFAFVHLTALVVLPMVLWLAGAWQQRLLAGVCWLGSALSYGYLGPRITALAAGGEHGPALDRLHAMAMADYGLCALAATVLAWFLVRHGMVPMGKGGGLS